MGGVFKVSVRHPAVAINPLPSPDGESALTVADQRDLVSVRVAAECFNRLLDKG